MICSNCGKEFNDEFYFCPYCGAEAPSIMICTNCGFKSPKCKFCPKCGFQLLTEDEINNEKVISHINKAIKLEKEGKYKRAMNCINIAIEGDPDNTEYKNKLD